MSTSITIITINHEVHRWATVTSLKIRIKKPMTVSVYVCRRAHPSLPLILPPSQDELVVAEAETPTTKICRAAREICWSRRAQSRFARWRGSKSHGLGGDEWDFATWIQAGACSCVIIVGRMHVWIWRYSHGSRKQRCPRRLELDHGPSGTGGIMAVLRLIRWATPDVMSMRGEEKGREWRGEGGEGAIGSYERDGEELGEVPMRERKMRRGFG